MYYCRSLAIAFIEQTALQRYHDYTHDPSVPAALQPVLRNLSALYGLWSLSKHLAVLYQGEIRSLNVLCMSLLQSPDLAGAGNPSDNLCFQHFLTACLIQNNYSRPNFVEQESAMKN